MRDLPAVRRLDPRPRLRLSGPGVRFAVERRFANLWLIYDAWQNVTEYVLFGVRSDCYVRLFVVEGIGISDRGALEELVRVADREGIEHTLRVPHYSTRPYAY